MIDLGALADRLEQLPKLAGTNKSALCLSAGLARSYLDVLLVRLRTAAGDSEPSGVKLGHLSALAEAANVSLGYVVGVGFRLKDQPGWARAVDDAQKLYPTVSKKAWAAAGDVHVPKEPKRIDAAFAAAVAGALQGAGAVSS